MADMLARLLIPVLALTFWAATVASAAERRYLELTTPEFTLVSAANEAETRRIANQVGMFRAAVARAFGATLPTEIPTRIYALSREDWKQYAEPRPGVAGYFLAHPFSSDLLFDVDDEASGAYELMFHEYTHYILRALWAGDIPAFIDEGLAEVFSTARFRNDEVLLEPRRDYMRYLRKHDWLPFTRLTEIKRHDAEYVDHALAPAFYAQSWATMFRAIATDPEFGPRIAQYVRDLNAGVSRLQAAERLIGEPASEANAQIAKFLRQRRNLIARIPIGEAVKHDDWHLRTLDHDASTGELAELMLRFGDRHAQALELLALAKPTTRVQVGAAWAHLQGKDSERAGELMDAAAQLHGELPAMEPPTAVSLARGLFQLAAAASHGKEKPEGLARKRMLRARALFETALDCEPVRLEAINGYVLASLALNMRDDSLMSLARSAFRVAPKSAELAVGLALLHELNGEKMQARQYWQAAARSTHAGPMQARILAALENQGATIAETP
jgi:hypothetical protein